MLAAAKSAESVADLICVDDAVEAEVDLRQEASRPVLRERVAAGAEHRPPEISGERRATRNVSEHAALGHGCGEVRRLLQTPKQSQCRCRRRRRTLLSNLDATDLPEPTV